MEEVFLGRRKFGMVRKEGEEEKSEERERRGPFNPFEGEADEAESLR